VKTLNPRLISFVLVAIFCVSCVSAMPDSGGAWPLQPGAEGELQGGSGSECAQAWGLGLALAAASLSPCSVVCAALAWYDLALIGAFCD
jgi:hypothetical protein